MIRVLRAHAAVTIRHAVFGPMLGLLGLVVLFGSLVGYLGNPTPVGLDFWPPLVNRGLLFGWLFGISGLAASIARGRITPEGRGPALPTLPLSHRRRRQVEAAVTGALSGALLAPCLAVPYLTRDDVVGPLFIAASPAELVGYDVAGAFLVAGGMAAWGAVPHRTQPRFAVLFGAGILAWCALALALAGAFETGGPWALIAASVAVGGLALAASPQPFAARRHADRPATAGDLSRSPLPPERRLLADIPARLRGSHRASWVIGAAILVAYAALTAAGGRALFVLVWSLPWLPAGLAVIYTRAPMRRLRVSRRGRMVAAAAHAGLGLALVAVIIGGAAQPWTWPLGAIVRAVAAHPLYFAVPPVVAVVALAATSAALVALEHRRRLVDALPAAWGFLAMWVAAAVVGTPVALAGRIGEGAWHPHAVDVLTAQLIAGQAAPLAVATGLLALWSCCAAAIVARALRVRA